MPYAVDVSKMEYRSKLSFNFFQYINDKSYNLCTCVLTILYIHRRITYQFIGLIEIYYICYIGLVIEFPLNEIIAKILSVQDRLKNN